MDKFNREKFPLAIRVFRALISLFKIILSAANKQITFKQLLLDLKFRLISQSKIQNDDFDWEKYPNYYKEELKSISRAHTLLISNKNFEFSDGLLIKNDSTAKELHPNHEVLYRAVLILCPDSVLEVGCGGGDHLANIKELDPTIQLQGVDRSNLQLETFRERHPELSSIADVADLTKKDCSLQMAELVFTQAVLMHISEIDGRFQTALRNIFSAAKSFVVLVENWSQHNFLSEIEIIRSTNQDWAKSYLYIINSDRSAFSTALIVSKIEVSGLTGLISYEQLLAGRKILVH